MLKKYFQTEKNGYINYTLGTGMFNANNKKLLSAILKEHFLAIEICPR